MQGVAVHFLAFGDSDFVLSLAHKTGALATKDLQRLAVDTTVQTKAIAHLTDARLMHQALEELVTLARRHGMTPSF